MGLSSDLRALGSALQPPEQEWGEPDLPLGELCPRLRTCYSPRASWVEWKGFGEQRQALHAGVGAGLGLRAAGGGPGLVYCPKFETAAPVRAFRDAGSRAQGREPGPGPVGGEARSAQLLDRESSHSSTARSVPGRSLAGVSGSSSEGTSPQAPKRQGSRPSLWEWQSFNQNGHAQQGSLARISTWCFKGGNREELAGF